MVFQKVELVLQVKPAVLATGLVHDVGVLLQPRELVPWRMTLVAFQFGHLGHIGFNVDT
jgi:hypothetical protein